MWRIGWLKRAYLQRVQDSTSTQAERRSPRLNKVGLMWSSQP